MKVIINADDLGKNKDMNDAISTCLHRGLITSSTIMAGGDNFDEGVAIALSHPECSIGVHLSLDEYHSITSNEKLKQIGVIDENGDFVRHAFTHFRPYTQAVLDAVYEEWRAQIQKVKDAGIMVSHLDSHHHIHMYKPLFSVFVRLLQEFGIKKARSCGRKSFTMLFQDMNEKTILGEIEMAGGLKGLLVELKKYLSDTLWLLKLHDFAKTSDYFCQYLYFLNNYEVINKSFADSVVEVMVHPGHPLYDEETKLLEALPSDCTKITYNDL